jgi:hypothetical protein
MFGAAVCTWRIPALNLALRQTVPKRFFMVLISNSRRMLEYTLKQITALAFYALASFSKSRVKFYDDHVGVRIRL